MMKETIKIVLFVEIFILTVLVIFGGDAFEAQNSKCKLQIRTTVPLIIRQ